MPGTAIVAPRGLVYHVLHRSVGRVHMFTICRRGSSSGRGFGAGAVCGRGHTVTGWSRRCYPLAGGTADELDGSRQLPSNREGIRPSADEPRQRTSLRRGRLGDANCKPTGLAAHGSSGRPAPQSEPICGRDDKPAPGGCWKCQTHENRKPSPPQSPPTAN